MVVGLAGVAAAAVAFGYSGSLAVGIGSGLPGLVCFFIGLLLLASQKKS